MLQKPELKLSTDQKAALTSIQREWSLQKANAEQEMGRFSPHAGRLADIRLSLGEYSEISRQFDATRSWFWEQSLLVLNASQRKLAEETHK